MEQNLKGVSQVNEKEFYDTIMRLWTNNINKNVEAKDLKFSIKLLVDKGFSFEYILFVLNYVIKNKYKLQYPGGFKYYVEYEEIKKAYEKKNRKFIKMSDFTAVDTDDYPRYTYHAKKSMGFADIFGGGG